MFQVSYEKRVFKDLDKIPNHDVERINDVFKTLPLNPRPLGSEKLSGQPGLYRIRKGDYRIVYAIDVKEKSIKILLVRHRRDVYRRL